MELSARDWALALLSIKRLHQICKAYEEMFGTLSLYLNLSEEQSCVPNAELDRSMASHVDAQVEDIGLVTSITTTGVVKTVEFRTLEDAFLEMQDEALRRFRSETGGEDEANN